MPVKDEFSIRMTAQDAGMVQAWLDAKKGPEEFANSMEKMGKKGKQSSDTLGASLDAMFGKFATGASMIALAQKALDFYMESNRRAIQEGRQATEILDQSFRKLMVQGNIRAAGISEAQMKQMVTRSATSAAVPIPFATSAAQQAISSGFNTKDILQSGGLDAILQFANATNSTDQDPAQMVKSIGLFLGASGQNLTTDNLRRTLVGTQRLYKGTNLQASALNRLAQETSQISSFGNLDGDDILSIQSVLLQELGEDRGSTSLRSTITDLATLGKDKQKVSGLARMGLKPGDVDMVGESFTQALERINTAANKLDPATRNVVMSQIFRQESMPGIGALMSDQGRAQIATNRALMGDEAGFMADVQTATTGPAAEMRRNDARRMAAMDARGLGQTAVATGRMAAESIEAGDAPTITAIKELAAEQAAAAGGGGGFSAGFGREAGNVAGGYAKSMAFGPLGAMYEMYQAGSRAIGHIEIILRDEDNRAVPTEHIGRQVERQAE